MTLTQSQRPSFARIQGDPEDNAALVAYVASIAGGLSDGDKGVIVVASSGTVWTFDTNVVTTAALTVLDDTTVAAMLATLGGAALSSITQTVGLLQLNIQDATNAVFRPLTVDLGRLYVDGTAQANGADILAITNTLLINGDQNLGTIAPCLIESVTDTWEDSAFDTWPKGRLYIVMNGDPGAESLFSAMVTVDPESGITLMHGSSTINVDSTGITVAGTLFATSPRFTTNIAPATNDAAALGTTTLGWADLHLATGALINVANGNAVITHSSGIFTVSTGDWRVTTAGTNTASVVTVGGTQTLTNKTLTSPVLSADDAYDATSWNASLAVPTKNAIRDKIEVLLPLAGGTMTSAILHTEVTNTITANATTVTLSAGNHQTIDLANATAGVTINLTVPSTTAAGTLVILPDDTTRAITWAVSSGTIEWIGDAFISSTVAGGSQIVSYRKYGTVTKLALAGAGAAAAASDAGLNPFMLMGA